MAKKNTGFPQPIAPEVKERVLEHTRALMGQGLNRTQAAKQATSALDDNGPHWTTILTWLSREQRRTTETGAHTPTENIPLEAAPAEVGPGLAAFAESVARPLKRTIEAKDNQIVRLKGDIDLLRGQLNRRTAHVEELILANSALAEQVADQNRTISEQDNDIRRLRDLLRTLPVQRHNDTLDARIDELAAEKKALTEELDALKKALLFYISR